MKILFTSQGKEWNSNMDPRFGRAAWLLIYDEEKDYLEAIDNQEVQKEAHGAGTATAQKVFEHKPNVIITGNGPGGSAAKVLKMFNPKIFTIQEECSIAEAFEKYKNREMDEFYF
jgi:predicted Fe-Mo cluster-binding NifX family protein